jgi:hypothetical protein
MIPFELSSPTILPCLSNVALILLLHAIFASGWYVMLCRDLRLPPVLNCARTHSDSDSLFNYISDATRTCQGCQSDILVAPTVFSRTCPALRMGFHQARQRTASNPLKPLVNVIFSSWFPLASP